VAQKQLLQGMLQVPSPTPAAAAAAAAVTEGSGDSASAAIATAAKVTHTHPIETSPVIAGHPPPNTPSRPKFTHFAPLSPSLT
jgi:hypothetical protein